MSNAVSKVAVMPDTKVRTVYIPDERFQNSIGKPQEENEVFYDEFPEEFRPVNEDELLASLVSSHGNTAEMKNRLGEMNGSIQGKPFLSEEDRAILKIYDEVENGSRNY